MTRTQKHTRQPYHVFSKLIIFSKFTIFSFLFISLFLCSMQNVADASPYPTIAYYPDALLVAENSAESLDIQQLQEKADNGDVEAQYSLGYMYAYGEGVEQDYTKAIKYYELAASLGNANAHYNLGVMYYNGEGVTQNYSRAYGYILVGTALNPNAKNVQWIREELLNLLSPEKMEESEIFAENLLKEIEANKNQ